ncbi:MAG: 30S ribosomal protein S16 [Thermodesulfobacteriota bacterium]|nr:MAG: 30S ribosomal protein S16 [Thermodesulfobacteriota bacterium]
MAVRIRLARYGSKKKPFYRVVVTDKSSPRDGRFLEVVGTYNPLTDPPKVDLKAERVTYWISNGAVPTGTVKQLIKKAGIEKAA